MENEIVDQVMAEAQAEPAPVDQQTEVAPETQEDQTQVDQPKEVPEQDRKFENMKSRHRAEKRALQEQMSSIKAELESMKTQAGGQQKTDGAPQEDQFENFGDYLKAVARYEAKQELAQGQKAQQEQTTQLQEQQWVQERVADIQTKFAEFTKTTPEAEMLLEQNVELLDSLPPYIERAFYEADNAPLAFYALAKEGALESLATMSPYQAAMAIARAELRGAEMTKPKVTKAPAPIQSAKGTGVLSKNPNSMNPDELYSWYRN